MYDLLLKGGNVHRSRRRTCAGRWTSRCRTGRSPGRREHPGVGRPARRSHDGQDGDARPDRSAHPRLRRRGPTACIPTSRASMPASPRWWTREAPAARPSARFRGTSCRSARPRSSRCCTSARPGSRRTPTSSPRAASISRAPSGRGRAQGAHQGDQGAHGLARAGDLRDGDAAPGQAGGARERHAADGPHRRHHQALRRERDPQLLPLLEPGDIVTHLFTANPGGVLDADGKLVPEARSSPPGACGSTPLTAA